MNYMRRFLEMNSNDYTIRPERKEEYREVEKLVSKEIHDKNRDGKAAPASDIR
jgi:hypothetical protein